MDLLFCGIELLNYLVTQFTIKLMNACMVISYNIDILKWFHKVKYYMILL